MIYAIQALNTNYDDLSNYDDMVKADLYYYNGNAYFKRILYNKY